MSASSLNFNLLMMRHSLVLLHTPKMVQDWMLLLVVFGVVVSNVPFDMWIFNPHAPSNNHPRCYRRHELEKKCRYEQWVREVEHACFTPLALSAPGGMGSEATVFYKRLISCLATNWGWIILVVQLCPGFNVNLLFPFFDHQSSVSGVLARAVDMRPSFRPHHWTWSYLNLMSFSFLSLSISQNSSLFLLIHLLNLYGSSLT